MNKYTTNTKIINSKDFRIYANTSAIIYYRNIQYNGVIKKENVTKTKIKLKQKYHYRIKKEVRTNDKNDKSFLVTKIYTKNKFFSHKEKILYRRKVSNIGRTYKCDFSITNEVL